jgi:predicted metal-dependent hydrolase
MKQMDDRILYGGRVIEFRILFAARKTMQITVYPDGQVVVKAPVGTEPQVIREKLQKRARWIIRQLGYFDQFEPRTPARRYVGGESHLYLGRRYRLKIEKGKSDQVKLIGSFFYVTVKGPLSSERVKQLLYKWYIEKAKNHFKEILEQCLQRFQREFQGLGVPRPMLLIRRMKTRWGSLSPKGTLTLNMDLIRAPKQCIEYVIIHELCHLRRRHHDTAFYRLLKKHMPDWEKRKHQLERTLV